MNKFQIRLRQALSESGMTQSELGRRTGIDRTVISGYVRGKFKPKQDNLHSLATVLNVNEAWLMGFDVDKRRSTHYSVPKEDGESHVHEPKLQYQSDSPAPTNQNKSLDELVDEMHSYRGLEISDAQRESIKAILKAYLDTQLKDDDQDK